MTREEYYKTINSILDEAIAKLSETLDTEEKEIAEDFECDGNCEECEHYHEYEGLEFEDMLTLIKDDPDLTFTCPQTFEDGEYITGYNKDKMNPKRKISQYMKTYEQKYFNTYMTKTIARLLGLYM